MKKIAAMIMIFWSMVATVALADMNSPVGKWKSIDDETQQPKSIVEISEVDCKLTGKIRFNHF